MNIFKSKCHHNYEEIESFEFGEAFRCTKCNKLRVIKRR